MTSFVDPNTGDTLNYTYDAAGNVTSKYDTTASNSWSYAYNNSNQLTAVTETDTSLSETKETVAYEYDAFGNLIEETVTPYTGGVAGTPVTTEYAVDGWNPAKAGSMGNSAFDTWAVMNGSSDLQTRNIQGNGIDQILARVDNATNGANDPTGLYFDLTDRLGSVRDVLHNTPDASPVVTMTYDAWGNLISPSPTSPSAVYEGMYGFDGYQSDAATNLYLDHARVYDPQSQRWMSQDPMGFDAGDSNLYRYVHNAPTNATDPSGLASVAVSMDRIIRNWLHKLEFPIISPTIKDGGTAILKFTKFAFTKNHTLKDAVLLAALNIARDSNGPKSYVTFDIGLDGKDKKGDYYFSNEPKVTRHDPAQTKGEFSAVDFNIPIPVLGGQHVKLVDVGYGFSFKESLSDLNNLTPPGTVRLKFTTTIEVHAVGYKGTFSFGPVTVVVKAGTSAKLDNVTDVWPDNAGPPPPAESPFDP